MIRLLARLLAAVFFPKNLKVPVIFTRCRLISTIQTQVLPSRKQIQQAVVVLPARILQSSTACGGKVVEQTGRSIPGAFFLEQLKCNGVWFAQPVVLVLFFYRSSEIRHNCKSWRSTSSNGTVVEWIPVYLCTYSHSGSSGFSVWAME